MTHAGLAAACGFTAKQTLREDFSEAETFLVRLPDGYRFSRRLAGPFAGNDLRKQFVDLAGLLGSYNEGIIGPGHCTENTNPA